MPAPLDARHAALRPAGTRVVAPELLCDWAQPGAGPQVLQAWLAGQPLPAQALPLPRL